MTKVDTSEVKRGTVLNNEGQLCKVVEIGHTHMGRGGATYNFKVKNILTGATVTLTYKAGTTLEKADVMTKNAVFLYQAGDNYSFMENDTSEIHELPYEEISDIADYLKENLDVFAMVYNGRVIGILLPPTITYKITQTVPGVKGDRSNAGKKPATLESGLEVQVPLHKNEGDTVSVNTETGQAS